MDLRKWHHLPTLARNTMEESRQRHPPDRDRRFDAPIIGEGIRGSSETPSRVWRDEGRQRLVHG